MDLQELTVFVVEDAVVTLDLVSHILITNQFKVKTARNGLDALAQIEETMPDLILLDNQLPDISGSDVCLQLKAKEKTQNIPVIFLSGLRDVEDKVKAFSSGAVDYITKPFRTEEVLARIKTHLTNSLLQKQLIAKTLELENSLAALDHEKKLRENLEKELKEKLKGMLIG